MRSWRLSEQRLRDLEENRGFCSPAEVRDLITDLRDARAHVLIDGQGIRKRTLPPKPEATP